MRRVLRSARKAAFPATLGALSWVNWKGRPPAVSTRRPKRASSKYSLTANVWGIVTRIPSTGSNVAAARVEPAAGRLTVAAVGAALPVETTATAPAVAAVSSVMPKVSATVPVAVTLSPTASPAGQLLPQNTRRPSEVLRSSSTSPSSSCAKKESTTSLFSNSDVTTASIVRVAPTTGDVPVLPWMSWMRTSGTGALTVTTAVHEFVCGGGGSLLVKVIWTL